MLDTIIKKGIPPGLLLLIATMNILAIQPKPVYDAQPLTDFKSVPQPFKDVLKRITIYEYPSEMGRVRMSWNDILGDPIPKIITTSCQQTPEWNCRSVSFGYADNFYDSKESNKDYTDVFLGIEYVPSHYGTPGFYAHISLNGETLKQVFIDKENNGRSPTHFLMQKDAQYANSPAKVNRGNTYTKEAVDILMFFGGSYTLAYQPNNIVYANTLGSCTNTTLVPSAVYSALMRMKVWVPNDTASENAGRWFEIPYTDTYCALLSRSKFDGTQWQVYTFGIDGDEADRQFGPTTPTEALVRIYYNPATHDYDEQVMFTGWLPLQLYLDTPYMPPTTCIESPKEHTCYDPATQYGWENRLILWKHAQGAGGAIHADISNPPTSVCGSVSNWTCAVMQLHPPNNFNQGYSNVRVN